MGRKPRAANKIGRKRRATGWMLLPLGVVVAGLWVASRYCTVSYDSGDCGVFLIRGLLSVELHDRYDRSQWDFEWAPADRRCLYLRAWDSQMLPPLASQERWNVLLAAAVTIDSRSRWNVAIWPLPLLLWTPAALLLRSGILARRRAMTNACPKCGYSLAGLANDAPCPECGR